MEEGAEGTRQQHEMTSMEELKSFIFTSNIIDICDTIQICYVITTYPNIDQYRHTLMATRLVASSSNFILFFCPSALVQWPLYPLLPLPGEGGGKDGREGGGSAQETV